MIFTRSAVAQNPSLPPPAATTSKTPDYSSESFIIQKYATDVTYAADGTGERTITVQVMVQSDAAVRQFGVLEFPYESRNEHLDFVYVRVHKPDGSVVATPDTDAQDQPAEVTRQAPFYSDIRTRQLPVKSLSVGDQLEYQVHEVRTVAAAPGHFWYTQSFLKDAVVLEETASLTVPKQKYVQVESPDIKPEVSEAGDRRIYRWKTSQLEKSKIADDKTKKPVLVEKPPSIAVTTFKDWAEVGRWYGDLQKGRVEVTPTVQAKANELTKGLTTDEAEIAAIYSYVSTQYRYIGVAFGIGRYQPHSADDVMQNQYGDCKDKHTLLASLLKAEGYDAWPVLVGSQHVLQPNVPSPGQFDHVITAVTLNQSVLWMDSTPEVAPFRMLFSGLRDKEVLGIPDNATPVIMKTPANPPFDSLNKVDAKGSLAADGTLTARIDIALRGDQELLYRIAFHQTPRVQWQTLAQNVSYSFGFGGTVSNVSGGIPEKTAEPFEYSYDYARKDYADWANHRILPLMPPIAFSYGEDDAKPADTILLGGPVTYSFHTRIQLPDSYTAELPSPVKLQTDFAIYSCIYSLDKTALVAERSLSFKQREIAVSKWDEYIKFEKAVAADEDTFIQLIGAGAKQATGPATSNPEAAGLVRQAFAEIASRNFDLAKQNLDRAAALSPNETELWGAYGYLDISQNRVDDGIRKYQKELSMHPDRLDMYRYLAGVQESHKHPDDAVQTLRALLQAAPDDTSGHTQLASVLIRQKRFEDAIPVLTEAIKLSPEKAGLKVMLGKTQLSAGAKEVGTATLKSVLSSATDAGSLNDASYELADASLELPLARSSCEKALKLLDDETAKTSLTLLTDEDLQHMRLLNATWDTMAWILYRQGDFASAEKYAISSWMLDPSPTIGFHLGQIYEKLNRKEGAIHIYQMAIASGRGSADATDAHKRLTEIAPNKAEFNSAGPIGEELAKLRSVTIPVAGKKTGSADFFLLFAPKQIDDVQFLKGEESFRSSSGLLKQASFDQPFPPSSGAKIVRRGILYCSQTLKDCQFTMLAPEDTKRN